MCNFYPLKILGIHYDYNSNELFIGAKDFFSNYPVTQYSPRPVIILGQDCERKNTIEFSTGGKRLFTYPVRIDTDVNRTIYVVDMVNDEHHGRIVAVRRDRSSSATAVNILIRKTLHLSKGYRHHQM